jgi:hypothetical protein
VVAVGEAGEPGPDFLSLAGLLPLVVLSPERRNEFCRDRPVPATRNRGESLTILL